jgi:hypothetical protein
MKLIEITPEWIIMEYPYKSHIIDKGLVSMKIRTCDTYWLKLALDTLEIEYKYNEYVTTYDGVVYASIEFSLEDIRESCPTFYSFSKEIGSLNLCNGNALINKYLFKN